MNAAAGQPARRAAWNAYQAVAEGLLPALGNGDGDEVVNPRLGAVVIRIRRYAPMWKHDGPMLLAATASAVRLLRHGDRDGLTGLAQAMAHRLFAMAVGRNHRPHPGPRNHKNVGSKHFALGDGQPPGVPPNMRYREQQQHEKGLHDD